MGLLQLGGRLGVAVILGGLGEGPVAVVLLREGLQPIAGLGKLVVQLKGPVLCLLQASRVLQARVSEEQNRDRQVTVRKGSPPRAAAVGGPWCRRGRGGGR